MAKKPCERGPISDIDPKRGTHIPPEVVHLQSMFSQVCRAIKDNCGPASRSSAVRLEFTGSSKTVVEYGFSRGSIGEVCSWVGDQFRKVSKTTGFGENPSTDHVRVVVKGEEELGEFRYVKPQRATQPAVDDRV